MLLGAVLRKAKKVFSFVNFSEAKLRRFWVGYGKKMRLKAIRSALKNISLTSYQRRREVGARHHHGVRQWSVTGSEGVGGGGPKADRSGRDCRATLSPPFASPRLGWGRGRSTLVISVVRGELSASSEYARKKKPLTPTSPAEKKERGRERDEGRRFPRPSNQFRT